MGRFGNVLYWTACLLAGVITLYALVVATIADTAGDTAADDIFALLLVGAAVIIWLIGRGCRYVLARR
jgi:hypothetical protein